MYASQVRLLGVDYGRRRIGLALSDPTGLLARPSKTLASSGDVADAARVLAREIALLRCEADGLECVVVGLPRRLSGEPNEQTALVRSLTTTLQALVDIPIALQDERLSSREAESRLARREKDWRKRKALVDAAAAAVILQDHLDSRDRLTGEPVAGPRRALEEHDLDGGVDSRSRREDGNG